MTKIASHRGLHIDGYRENTLPAISAAFNKGADQVEFDVHITSDGVWVLHHDDTFYEPTNIIKNLRYDRLAAIATEKGVLLNTLDQVLEAHPTNWLNIECKSKGESYGVDLVSEIESVNRADFFHISSFYKETLTGIRSCSNQTRISLLGHVLILPSWSKFHSQFRLFSINPLHLFTFRNRIRVAHRHGLEVQVWGPSSPRALKRLLEIGADVIITDELHLARKLRTEIEQERSED